MRVCIGRCLDWPASEPTHTRSTEQPESWLAAQLCKAAGVCEVAELKLSFVRLRRFLVIREQTLGASRSQARRRQEEPGGARELRGA